MKFKTIGLFLFWGTIVIGSSQAQNSDSRAGDEAALEALYVATNGESWTNNTGWSSSGMSLEDDIYGVYTETVDGELRVRAIMLNGTTTWDVLYEKSSVQPEGSTSGNNLTGSLPAELGNLKQCLYFNVKQNSISGNIPPEIGNMTSLTRLLLNGVYEDPVLTGTRKHHPGKDYGSFVTNERTNQFSGVLPPELGNLRNLVYLEIISRTKSDPGLTGTIPPEIGNLTNLEGLWLDYNNMTGGIPDELVGLSSLVQLQLTANEFDGTISSDINTTWTNLKFLDISDNDFSGDFPVLDNLTRLRYLTIRQNEFTGNLDWLGDMEFENIVNIMVGSNNFTGNIPDVSNFAGIVTLEFYLNDFTGPLPNGLQVVTPKLYTFGWLPGITGTLPQTGWPRNSHLRALRMNDMPNLTGNIPADLLSSVDNDELQDLYFNNSGFTSVDIEAVANLQYGEVHLANNHLTFNDFVLDNGTIPGQIASYNNQKSFGAARTANYAIGTNVTIDDFDTIVTHPGNSYQWYKDGVPVSGATGKNLSLSNAQTSDSGTYTLQVTNAYVSGMMLTSAPIEVSVSE